MGKGGRHTPGRSINWLASLDAPGVGILAAGLDFRLGTAETREGEHMDPNPDYDASDELEYGVNWFAWILRGAYPPPAYPPV
jgi:hypothetical protein